MSETYTTGGDSGFPITPPNLIGQTFTPLVEHKLEYIDLNILKWTVGGTLKITVHDLDDDPDMTGYGISKGTEFTMEPDWGFLFRRTRIIMEKVTLHKDHAYGFCISNQPEPPWNEFVIKYDLADATYPRGQRFTKNNRADPPTYYPGSDLIFTEFGRPVAPPTPPNPDPDPPPTPPHPPIDKWLIIQTAQQRTLTGEIIIAYTNVPCHLWMRWSLVPPRIHKIPIIRRGLVVNTHFYYCFDVYDDNEQEEEGDTLIHTFVKEPWPYCQHRWWYFHGGVDASPSPSTGPIFDKHPKEPAITKLRAFNELFETYSDPDPLVGELIPDDAASFLAYSGGYSGYYPYWVERDPAADNFPIERVVVYIRFRQVPGDGIAHARTRPGLVLYAPRRLYFQGDWHLSTNEWETYETTFWANPYSGRQWTRWALNSFAMAINQGYDIADPGIWGDVQVTWMQVHIYPA